MTSTTLILAPKVSTEKLGKYSTNKSRKTMNLRKNHLSNLAPIINTISIGDITLHCKNSHLPFFVSPATVVSFCIYLNNVWEENKYDMFQKKSTSTSEYYGQRQQTDARPA